MEDKIIFPIIERVVEAIHVDVSKAKNEIYVMLTVEAKDRIGRDWVCKRLVPFSGRRTKKGMVFECQIIYNGKVIK